MVCMYGTVAWERSRKVFLPRSYYSVNESEEHDCGDCFKQARGCNHLCCEAKLFEYTNAMGFNIVTKKDGNEKKQEGGKKLKRKADTSKSKFKNHYSHFFYE